MTDIQAPCGGVPVRDAEGIELSLLWHVRTFPEGLSHRRIAPVCPQVPCMFFVDMKARATQTPLHFRLHAAGLACTWGICRGMSAGQS